jgi:hypothetical protein
MLITEERESVRSLARRVLELADSPENLAKIARYKKINALERVVPPVCALLPRSAADQLLHADQQCTDPYLRGVERQLLDRINRPSAVGDDFPITKILYSGFVLSMDPWMDGYKDVRIGDHNESSCFSPCLMEESDFSKMRKPRIRYDRAATDHACERLGDLLDDTLTVVRGDPYTSTIGWGDSMIDQFAAMRGLETLYYDFIDKPEWVHAVMRYMTEKKLELFQEYSDLGLFVSNSEAGCIGSSSFGFTEELKGNSASLNSVSAKDLWGFAHAQELSCVSPEMLEEFVLPYQAELINRFGLSCYGCCEAMEDKIEPVARHISNLRMISVSPYSNPEKVAEKCKDKYVFAWKPHPAFMLSFQKEAALSDLERTLTAAKDCCVTVTLMDVYDYGNDPHRFKEWVRMARSTAQRIFG